MKLTIAFALTFLLFIGILRPTICSATSKNSSISTFNDLSKTTDCDNSNSEKGSSDDSSETSDFFPGTSFKIILYSLEVHYNNYRILDISSIDDKIILPPKL